MFEVKITGLKAKVTKNELLTTGTVGAQIKFTFSDDWADKTKTAVFKRCGKVIDVLESDWGEDNVVTIPPEMTEKAGQIVGVGIYGRNADGKKVTPTIYAPLGVVAVGADPSGDESVDPSLPVYSQIQAELNDLKDDLNDVSKRAVQSDWSQNDPEQPDYVKNRTHASNPQYISQGTAYTTWASLTRYAQVPIPKVTVDGIDYYNVKAAHYYAFATHLIADYELAEGVVVSVYADEQRLVPPMEMYTYDSGTSPLSTQYIPQVVDWSTGNPNTGEYVKNRYGGFIEPTDTVIGHIEWTAQSGSGIIPSSAYNIAWIDTAPKNSDAVRIAGVYTDGTPFDECCLYGAFAYRPVVSDYGDNPFRFNRTSVGGQITSGVVQFATIFSATLKKHPDWTLPLFTDAGSPTWALAHRAGIRLKSVDYNAWQDLGQDQDGVFYSQTDIRVIPSLSSIRDLMDRTGVLYQVQSSEFIAALLKTALGGLSNPPYRIFTRKQPDSSGMTFGFDIEDAEGNWVYMIFSVYSTDAPLSTEIVRRAHYSINVSVDMDAGTATADDISFEDLTTESKRCPNQILVRFADQPTSIVYYTGTIPEGFMYTTFDQTTGKMQWNAFFLHAGTNPLTWYLEGTIEFDYHQPSNSAT